MKNIQLIGGALAAMIVFGGPAFSASSRDAQVDRLIDAGSSLVGQRVPVPKIRVPGPRTQADGMVQLAQAGDPRVTQLEEQIRQLNGLVEELNFQVLQMQDQLRKMQEDNEFRFQELEKRGDAGAASSTQQHANNSSVEEIIEDNGTMTAGNEPAVLPRNLGSVKFDANGNIVGGTVAEGANLPGVETGPAITDNTQVAALPSTSDPDELYRNSYEFVLSGDYGTAETGFRQHIERFPDDARAADSHFWLGEALLGQQKYRDAAQVFLGATRDYPDARKAPEMMLKLGMSLSAMNQRDVACATLAEVPSRYPQASTAVLERVKVEKAKASC